MLLTLILLLISSDKGSNEAADLLRWQNALAHQYNRTRTLIKLPLDELIDDPKKLSLRHLYTRTQITETKGWPPMAMENCDEYNEYSSVFTGVILE